MTDTNKDDSKNDEEKMRLAFEAFMLTGKNTFTIETKKDDACSSAASAAAATNKNKKKKKKKKSSTGGGGSGGTPSKSPTRRSPASVGKAGGNSGASTTTTTYQSPLFLAKSDKKKYFQLLRSFSDKVKHSWLDLDDQILTILQNIVSIRGRLPLEWKILHSSSPTSKYLKHHVAHDEQKRRGKDNDPTIAANEVVEDDDQEWKYHGYQGKPKEVTYSSLHLHTKDAELALVHDLLQHEKMLGYVRSLMANLADCHDGLGRVVDALWKFHLECTAAESGEEVLTGSSTGEIETIMDCVTNIYQMLSLELYRKQSQLVPIIMESATDEEVLGTTNNNDSGRGSLTMSSADGQGGTGGLKTARECCKAWS
eukprot:CAMPEP_0183737684 /NCGR_PEP_ID=MMETSP0737-20130205/52618_1 /TAXON_ID=385413 /ORGANISM="Thalassiosira miniscula, Strain CCMP1093" /LENGTH=367 /DNA_ID=CAMNT_0025972025 /DNA_START=294 /DNA_END=1394 /DNA_ORIENTATION=+